MQLDLTKFEVKKPKELNVNVNSIADLEKILTRHGGTTLAEAKYDGYGILIDRRNGLELHSLQKKPWNPACLPELEDDLHHLPPGFYIGELVGKPTHDDFTNVEEFQAVNKRGLLKPTPELEQAAREQPLEIRVYDLLELRGEILARKPLKEVRTILEDTVHLPNINPVVQRLITDAATFQQATLTHFASGKEGFVVKKPTATYSPEGAYVIGKRNDDWVKIKRSVSFDLVILGLYQTPERLAAGWHCSNALMGTYNEQTGLFETMVKLTMASKNFAEEIYNKVAPHCKMSWSNESPYFWQNSGKPFQKSEQVDYSPELSKRVWIDKLPFLYVTDPRKTGVVLEVEAMQVTTAEKNSWHSCGLREGQTYSLRHPTFLRKRDDKTALEATTTEQVRSYLIGVEDK